MNKEFERVLASHHLRNTTPRKKVFTILQEAHEPLFIGEIVRRAIDIDRVSVYRTIELLVEIGVVVMVPIGWKKRYELADPFHPHHHHIQCVSCQKLKLIEDPKLEAYIGALATKRGYVLQGHALELQGICSACQAKPNLLQ